MSGKFSFPDPKRDIKAALTIDTDQLEAFAADAKERKGGHRPWDKHDPKALPKHNVSVRLNDYHLEMLRYLAEDMDMSQQKILRKHIVPVIEQLAEQAYMDRTSKAQLKVT
jgi:hypothetical protein